VCLCIARDMYLLFHRSDRRYKECQMMHDEEKSNSSRLQDQVNTLNSKNRTLKRNLDDSVRA